MVRKLRAEQYGAFPDIPAISEKHRFYERERVISRALAERAGLPSPERPPYQNLGNRELPIFHKKEIIQKSIRDHQISMVEGETGSGKSTQIAQYALEMGYPKIIYLEPRVLLADNLADQIEKELSSELGTEAAKELIGVRHSERSTGYGKNIEIMTPGTYLRVIKELEAYEDEPVLIVGDEIHEKDFETELAVAASVKRLKDHPKWRLVLASATLDADSIHDVYTEINGRPIPLTSVEGRPHQLEYYEEPELTAAEAYAKYGSDHAKTQMFTTGKQEIITLSSKLQKPVGADKLRITPLHAKLSRREIKQATHAELSEGEFQAIPSTNAGQSGITIPGQTMVITDGTIRRVRLNQEGGSGLFKEYCSQDELTQQGGRAGRDVAGGIVVLVKPDDENFEFKSFKDRIKQAPPQIDQINLNSGVLLATSVGMNFYEDNELLPNKVKEKSRILEAYESLYRLGAIDEFNEVTEIGNLMLKFPVRPEFSRALVEGINRGASVEVMQHLAAAISALEAGGMRYFEPGGGSNWRHDIRRETQDDVMAELDMFYATRPFCSYNQIDKVYEVDESALQERNYDLKNTRQAHKTFDKIARTLGLSLSEMDLAGPMPDEVEEIRDYLLAGMFDFAYRKVGVNGSNRKPEYVSVVNDGEGITRRELTDRGTYKGSDNLVIGIPRDFEKMENGQLVEHNAIENVFPTSVQKLTRHVLHLAQRDPVTHSEIIGGRLKRSDDLYFGQLKLQEVDSIAQMRHTPDTRAKLREAAYNKPTQTLEELTAIKKQLEGLQRLTPVDEIDYYFPRGIMTHEWLQRTIDQAIDDEVDNIYALDNKLRTTMIHSNISIRTWLDEDKELELIERSPEIIELPGQVTYTLYYSHGQPVINGFNLIDADVLPTHGLYLNDGREVLINYRLDHKTKAYPANVIKDYAEGLY